MGGILCAGGTFAITEDADVRASDCAVASEARSCALVATEELGADA